MNLHCLKLFYTVGLYESVTIAAEKLYISQPAVTVQIKKLEAEFNHPLLVPKGRGIELTEIGLLVFEEAKKLFAQEKVIIDLLENYQKEEIFELRISGNYVGMNYFLPDWVHHFQTEKPSLKFIAKTLNTEVALAELLAKKCDVIVTGSGIENYQAELNLRRINQGEFWFVTSANHPLSNKSVNLADVVDFPFIMRENGSYTDKLLKKICLENALAFPQSSQYFHGMHEAILAVNDGNGVFLCSEIIAKPYIEEKKMARVFVKDIQLQSVVYLGTRKNEKINLAVETLLNYVATI